MTSQPIDLGEFHIRKIRPEEAEKVFDILLKPLGWKTTIERFHALIEHLKDTVHVAITDDGYVGGTYSITEVRPGEFVLGNVVTREGLRGHGIGRKMMEHALKEHPADILTAHVVEETKGFYRSLGFTPSFPTYEVYHFKNILKDLESLTLPECDVRVMPCSHERMEEVMAYDEAARGYSCRTFLNILAKTAKILIAVNPSSGKIIGYTAGFVSPNNYMVEGLYADCDDIALLLYREVLKLNDCREVVKFATVKERPLLTKFGKIDELYCFDNYVAKTPSPLMTSKMYAVTDINYA